jgi:hypothetical protein
MLYLLNAALALGLYSDFTAPRGPSIALSPWEWLAWTGRRWFGGEFESDPARATLAELALRHPDGEPGAAFAAPGEWSMTEAWLEPWGEVTRLAVVATAGRLRVVHPAGFPIFDVGRRPRQPSLRQASSLCRGYGPLKAARLVRVRGRASPRAARLRWLSALSEYLRARLATALGAESAADTVDLVCRRHARIVVTSTTVDATFSLAGLPLEIRVAGLDRDPGWIPAAGRSVYFHYS